MRYLLLDRYVILGTRLSILGLGRRADERRPEILGAVQTYFVPYRRYRPLRLADLVLFSGCSALSGRCLAVSGAHYDAATEECRATNLVLPRQCLSLGPVIGVAVHSARLRHWMDLFAQSDSCLAKPIITRCQCDKYCVYSEQMSESLSKGENRGSEGNLHIVAQPRYMLMQLYDMLV